jgi:predicted dithiol-disulfide oxidoreductase (DUF899 family)
MPGTTLDQEIQSLTQEVMEKQAKLNELMRTRGDEPVADHTLLGDGNAPVRLSDTFGSHTDLIVIHNMGRGCAYCTLWADGFVGLHPHLLNRAAFVVVSPDAPDVQKQFAESRGWPFRMPSNADSGFTEAMGYAVDQDGKQQWWPGFSTFRKKDDGSIVRVAHGYFGPGDAYCGIWHLFAALAGGAGDWRPEARY